MDFEGVVVGAGPSALAFSSLVNQTSGEILILESGDRIGGAAMSGFHLIPLTDETDTCADIETLYPGALIRVGGGRIKWEKNWVTHTEVPFGKKDEEWLGNLPQWKAYFAPTANALFIPGSPMLAAEGRAVQVRTEEPISKLDWSEDDQKWTLTAPDKVYSCRKLIWAAGLTAFQNAFGKFETQAFLVPNPAFEAGAQDFRGGLSLEFEMPWRGSFDGVLAEEAEGKPFLRGLPFKHDGKRYLLLVVFARVTTADGVSRLEAKVLAHVDQEFLKDPKESLSFQKSMKRTLRAFLEFTQEESWTEERWVVSHHIGGHILGSPWLLADAPAQNIYFIGDETERAFKTGFRDLRGAVDSGIDLARELSVEKPLDGVAAQSAHQVLNNL